MLHNAQHTMTRTAIHINLFLFLFTVLFLNPSPTQAIGVPEGSPPSFDEFRLSIQNGDANALRGVYVPDVLALPVVQQPSEHPYYVSNHEGEITQFALASQYGNIGLLAHNNLSGRVFSQISHGQHVMLVYGDGRVESFVISHTLRFQAADPKSVSSSFRNLDQNEILSSGELFSRAYAGERHLVFQTCIEANGNASWGRLFIVALPLE